LIHQRGSEFKGCIKSLLSNGVITSSDFDNLDIVSIIKYGITNGINIHLLLHKLVPINKWPLDIIHLLSMSENTCVLTWAAREPKVYMCQQRRRITNLKDLVKLHGVKCLSKDAVKLRKETVLTILIEEVALDEAMILMDMSIDDCDLQYVTGKGETALTIACAKKNGDIMAPYILKHPCRHQQVNNEGETALFIACKRGYSEVADILLNMPFVEDPDPLIHHPDPLIHHPDPGMRDYLHHLP
jgi:hypothetical protein